MTNPQYENLTFKIPVESEDYMECSDFIVNAVESIMQNAMMKDTIKSSLTLILN